MQINHAVVVTMKYVKHDEEDHIKIIMNIDTRVHNSSMVIMFKC